MSTWRAEVGSGMWYRYSSRLYENHIQQSHIPSRLTRQNGNIPILLWISQFRVQYPTAHVEGKETTQQWATQGYIRSAFLLPGMYGVSGWNKSSNDLGLCSYQVSYEQLLLLGNDIGRGNETFGPNNWYEVVYEHYTGEERVDSTRYQILVRQYRNMSESRHCRI